MVVPDPNIYYSKLEYGVDDGKPWCVIYYENLMQNNADDFYEKECSYCNEPITSYRVERAMEFSTPDNTPTHVQIKMSCWCAMWLYKAQEKQREWNEIQPVFDEWVKEQEVAWVTSTN